MINTPELRSEERIQQGMTRKEMSEKGILYPQAQAAEKSLLASYLMKPGLICERIKPDYIYNSRYRIVLNALLEMKRQQKHIDTITVSDYLKGKVDEPELLIADLVQTDSNYSDDVNGYSDIILENYKARKLIDLGNELIEAGLNRKPVSDYEQRLSDINLAGSGYEGLVFVPTWDNEPEEKEPLVSFNQTKVLSRGNISLLTAPAGKGKSNVCATIWSACTGFFGDSLGFSVPDSLKVLFIDTEMCNRDSWVTRKRALFRAGIASGDPVPENLHWHNIRAIPTIDQKTDYFFQEIDSGKYDLIILDGIGDLVSNVNDSEECNNVVSRLCAIVHKRNIGVLVTLHTNPNDFSGKPRGHLGSELWRKVESNLIIESVKGSETRKITTSFSLGKNRSGSDKNTQCFCWSDDEKMHVSCGEPEGGKPDIFDLVIEDIKQNPGTKQRETINRIGGNVGKVNKAFKDAEKSGFIENKGKYEGYFYINA